ncbi:MAG TPA: histidine ammonia-lyase [Anaerolineales bacterium]|nr:histidine ammonia-lyase [Anaerolineales bacterium]
MTPTDTDTIFLDGAHLTLDNIRSVARAAPHIRLRPEARARVEDSARLVARLVANPTPVYGVNTGFGIFANRRIEGDALTELSRNLILSHAVGFGEPFSIPVVRAAMLIRANTLALGLSGVRPEIIDCLMQMLERGVTPVIPSQGSLGSSGDLAPLAHLGLVMTGGDDPERSGQAWFDFNRLSGHEAMRAAGIGTVQLGPKEGLALTNGATFAAALLSLACLEARDCLHGAVSAAALSMEALLGCSAALDEALHTARPHPGQSRVAAEMRALTRGSTLLDSGDQVQDAYSLRCTPQVVGPAWDILEFCERVVQREINSATDNPLLLGDTAISGGNFHGEPVGQAADFLKIALAEVGAISERRCFRLLSSHTNAALPAMLVARPEAAGLQSGFMMLQYTAASLVLENQNLASPASVLSLPTSADQEDHNANATTAARQLLSLTANLRRILAIELLVAAQALDLRLRAAPDRHPGSATAALHATIRGEASFAEGDDLRLPELERIDALIAQGEIGGSPE